MCSNLDGLRDYHTARGKLDKDKCHMISLICGIKKKKKKERTLFLQNRKRLTDIENKCMVIKRETGVEGGIN